MAEIEIGEWLESWAEGNLTEPGYHDEKSAMRESAKACAQAAEAAGYSIAELKEAAGGDLEEYLLKCQNGSTDTENRRTVESGES